MTSVTPEQRVESLYVYPVKSTAAVKLNEAALDCRGLVGDRRWLVTDQSGDFITGREFPRLVRIYAQPTASGIRLGAPGMADLEVSAPGDDQPRKRVMVWEDACHAVEAGASADAWVSEFLRFNARLMFMDSACVRPVPTGRGLAADEVSFADNYPLLAISRASLDDLSARTGASLDVRRFRPNLVVEGFDAYAEDRWRRVRIGEIEFDAVERCSRCGFTTIDPDTAEKHPAQEPLRTLGLYRRGEDGKVHFGRSLIPRGVGTLRAGDAVVPIRSQ